MRRIQAVENCLALVKLYEIIEMEECTELDLDSIIDNIHNRKERKLLRHEVARIRCGVDRCITYIDSNLSPREFISKLSDAVNDLSYLVKEEMCLS